MRKSLILSFLFVAVSVGLSYAGQANGKASADKAFVGDWTGSWTGGSSGKLEMTIKKEADGKLSGTMSPTPEQGGGYTVAFKTLTVSGTKMTAKFDDPSGEAEVSLEATLDGKTLKGTYSVKAQGSEVDTGSWTATLK